MKISVHLRRTFDFDIPAGTGLNVADLEIDLDSKEVKQDDVPITFTAKEPQLPDCLLQDKNRFVFRAGATLNVWDIDFNSNTDAINMYINYVRNKVSKTFDQKLIQKPVACAII